MSAAGERCGLFTPAVASALLASSRQAKGAALRSGASADSLRSVEDRARTMAMGTPCDGADLATAAGRVRTAFTGYSQIYSMDFPGAFGSWKADRRSPAKDGANWRLSQSTRASGGSVVFGMATDGPGAPALTAVVTSPSAISAAGARLVLRDPSKAPSPYLDTRRTGLGGRTTPRFASQIFLAMAKGGAPLGLSPAGAAGATSFRFPEAAARALEGLDPREAVTLELVFPTRDGERVETTLFEVGDFAAGRAFLAAQR
ncbi:MAG: hypothetical protein ABIO39_09680 [Caulobacteraceae bacterium]